MPSHHHSCSVQRIFILFATFSAVARGNFREGSESSHIRNVIQPTVGQVYHERQSVLSPEITVSFNESSDPSCPENSSLPQEGDRRKGLKDAVDNISAECLNQEDPLLHAPQFKPSTLVRVVILSIIAVISLVGNAATLLSVCRTQRQSRSTVYLMISQLAIADLLVTFFCVVAEAIWTYTVQWLAGEAMCKIVKYMQMFALYLSTFILVVIGFDRLWAVRFPMKRANARRYVRRFVAAVWILSCVLSLPQLVIFRVRRGPFIEEFYQCVTYGFYTDKWQEQLYTTISLVLMFLFPLIILILTYICTFYTISRKETGVSERTQTVMDDARRKIIQKAKMKSLILTVVIVLAFVICWTPYYCMMIIFIFLDPDEQFSEELQAGIFFFGSSTAMINPIIYGAFHLRRRPTRTQTLNNSSASSRAEKSVMLVRFKKSKKLLVRNESALLPESPSSRENGKLRTPSLSSPHKFRNGNPAFPSRRKRNNED